PRRCRVLLAGRLSGLLAVHVDAAAETGALQYADRGGKNIAATLRRLLHEHGFLGLQVAIDRALDDDRLRADICLDRALDAHGQALGMRDRAFYAALNQEVFRGTQIPLE